MKPSLTNFMEQPAPAPKPEKPQGEAVKNLTIRLPHSRWKRLVMLAIEDETSIQALTERLYEAEFDRRGLPF